jgi:hypothetical protein
VVTATDSFSSQEGRVVERPRTFPDAFGGHRDGLILNCASARPGSRIWTAPHAVFDPAPAQKRVALVSSACSFSPPSRAGQDCVHSGIRDRCARAGQAFHQLLQTLRKESVFVDASRRAVLQSDVHILHFSLSPVSSKGCRFVVIFFVPCQCSMVSSAPAPSIVSPAWSAKDMTGKWKLAKRICVACSRPASVLCVGLLPAGSQFLINIRTGFANEGSQITSGAVLEHQGPAAWHSQERM